MRLLTAAAGIMVFNLLWGLVQERVGAQPFCAEDGQEPHCERFRAVPVMNLVQASLASLVAYLAMRFRGMRREDMPVGLSSFAPPSLTHTIASPVGYAAMLFMPYPLYILVSSCKLIPVLTVGFLVNGNRPSRYDLLSAALMTAGVLSFSWLQVVGGGAEGSEGSGHHGKHHQHGGGGASSSSSLFGHELDPLSSIIVGVLFTLTNLTLEGFTQAGQDRLFGNAQRGGGAAAGDAKPAPTKRVPALWMQTCMNAWSVMLLSLALLAEGAWRGFGADSQLGYAARFAARHPTIVPSVLSFAILGSVAQLFIFASIESFGAFTTTTVTISRKFMSVLLSVAVFGHHLAPVQWAGVVLVFSGLGVQLWAGGRKHAHAAAAAAAAKQQEESKKDK
jgi:UDP-galactose transporter B1